MSVWNKLDRSTGLLAVHLAKPGERAAASIDVDRATITVVDALDPDADDDEDAPPGLHVLRRLVAHVDELRPGYVALLPDRGTIAASSLSVARGHLLLDGEPVTDRPFALLEITSVDDAADDDHADGHDPDDRLADLARARDRLHGALATHDRQDIDRVYRDVVRLVRAHPGLDDRHRELLVDGLDREVRAGQRAGLGAMPRVPLPWKAFLARLAPLEAVGPAGADGPPAPSDAPAVYWNTRLLDEHGALVEGALRVAQTYVLASKIDPAPADDALAGGVLAADDVEDGTPVTFVVQCKAPILRVAGTTAWERRVEGTVTYRAATTDTDAVQVEVRPVSAGPVAVGVQVVTRNAVRADVRVRLSVEDAGRATSTPAPAPAPAQHVGVSLAGPAAQLRLELTEDDRLVLSTGAVVGRPTPTRNAAALAVEAIDARRDLVALTGAYAVDPARAPFGLADPDAMLKVARIGAALHRAMFGTPDDDDDLNRTRLARTIADVAPDPAGVRLQIAAAYQPFPWAVFYDGAWRGRPLTDAASVDPSCFWGHRFRIDRALVTGHAQPPRRPVIGAPVRVQPCLNADLDRQQGVKVVEAQRALFGARPGVVVAPPIEHDADLRAYLAAQPAACDVLYFFGHAHAAQARDDLFTYRDRPPDLQARLVLDRDGAGVDVRAMEDLRSAPLDQRPLVILNACGSVAGDEAFQPQLLLQFVGRWKVAGVLGTDWPVPTVFADAFVRELLDEFIDRRTPLAAALARASERVLAQGNPFPLVYALYAPPDLTILPGAIP